MDPAHQTVVLMENGLQLALVVGSATMLLDERGQSLHTMQALHVGDYIREEYESRGHGPSIARKISVVIAAWRMLESPEF